MPFVLPTGFNRTHLTLAWIVVFAAVCQVMPGLDGLRWMPDDPVRLMPRMLRFEPDPLPWAVREGADAPPAPIDDEALLAQADAPPLGPIERGAAAPATAAPKSERDIRVSAGPIPLKTRYTDESPLPAPPLVRESCTGLPLLSIEDPHDVLARFYAKLERAGDGQGQVRVVHYGDSLITGDYITQTLRRLLQKKFGDAGHGFVLAGRTSPWYRRNRLDLSSSDDWRINRLTKPTVPDGLYGLGGVTFRTNEGNAWVEWAPTKPRGTGEDVAMNTTFSRTEIWYLAQPRGGRFEVRVDGEVYQEVSTRRETEGTERLTISLPDARHVVRVRTLGGGEVRLFGAVFERDHSGVVYDSLGVDGTRVKLLSRFDPEHWSEQLRLRRADLIVLHYGTNEGEAADLGTKNVREDLRPVVQHLRRSLPEVPCLLIGPMDRADRDEHSVLVSRPVVQRITDVQRRVAYVEGCAFFDTFRAMGGEGSMAQWARTGLGGGDYTHPSKAGADRIGAMVFSSLMEGLRRSGSAD